MELIQKFFSKYRGEIESISDIDAVDAQIEYWTESPEGREEFRSILYDGGARDSDFVFDVEFDQYRQE